MSMNTNEELLKISLDWLHLPNVKNWIATNGNCEKMVEWAQKTYGDKFEKYYLSEPFVLGIPEYKKKKPLLMIVGQETDIFGCVDTVLVNGNIDEKLLKKSQNWVINATAYLNNLSENAQWCNYHDQVVDIHLKSSPFFRLIRALSQKYNVCWNNLDKIHYTVTIKDAFPDKDIKGAVEKSKEEVASLYLSDEEKLFLPSENCKSLLQMEIDCIKPDIVLFVTGPSYKKSMEIQIGKVFASTPNTKKFIVHAANKNYLWTYHPSYLNMEKLFDQVVDKVSSLAKELE